MAEFNLGMSLKVNIMFNVFGRLFCFRSQVRRLAPDFQCLSVGTIIIDIIIIITQVIHIISSPEHEVPKVSYFGQSMSVVRRESCVVRPQ